MMTAPARRVRPDRARARARTARVRAAYQAATRLALPPGDRPVMAAGRKRPKATLRVLLFIASLRVAGPRPRRARWTAATALGRLVIAASTMPPVTMPGTASRVPREVAGRSMARLAATTTIRATVPVS